jgi:hypothetical protein
LRGSDTFACQIDCEPTLLSGMPSQSPQQLKGVFEGPSSIASGLHGSDWTPAAVEHFASRWSGKQ